MPSDPKSINQILFSESWDIDGGDADMIDWGEVQLLDKDHNITSLVSHRVLAGRPYDDEARIH